MHIPSSLRKVFKSFTSHYKEINMSNDKCSYTFQYANLYETFCNDKASWSLYIKFESRNYLQLVIWIIWANHNMIRSWSLIVTTVVLMQIICIADGYLILDALVKLGADQVLRDRCQCENKLTCACCTKLGVLGKKNRKF